MVRHGEAPCRHALEQAGCGLVQAIFAILATGVLIGLVLLLVGGGGSILAVPLLVGLAGLPTHLAIGTAAIGVALNALMALIGHARAGTVKWPCALVFAVSGMAGAAAGAELGKATDPDLLLSLFGVLMMVVGLSMFWGKGARQNADVRLSRQSAGHLLPRLVPFGLAVGLLAGFFGIGGGFLIVPGIMMATRMPISYAVGSSLAVIVVLGATTAGSYAFSGLVDWSAVLLLLIGGAAGAASGAYAQRWLTGRQKLLERGFAAVVVAGGAAIASGVA